MRGVLPYLSVVLVLCGAAFAQEKPAKRPPPRTPRELAERALDAVRDKVHKERMRIVWPPDEDEEMPDDAEVTVVRGYISFTCERVTWRKGVVTAGRVVMGRTWFYSQRGEYYEGEELKVDPKAFARAWRAAMLLLEADAERKKPKEPQKVEVLPDGTVVGHVSGSFRSEMSSHQSTTWLRLTAGGERKDLYNWSRSGRKYADDIRNFEELRNEALVKLFDGLLPEHRQKQLTPNAVPRRQSGTPFLMVDGPELTDAATRKLLLGWAPRLTQELKAATANAGLGMRSRECLVLDTTLRILGESGYEPSLAIIESLRKKLTGADDRKHFYAGSVRAEAEIALAKIRLLNHWDTKDAAKRLRTRRYGRHVYNDQDKWIRTQFFHRDRDGYKQALLEDLSTRSEDGRLMKTSIAELARRYPGASLDELAKLLTNCNPQTAADVAIAILKHRPAHKGALDLLDRLAGDTSIPIPPRAHQYDAFGRTNALLHMTAGNCPPGRRWTTDRVRRQLAKPDEDGRMVLQLIGIMDDTKTPMTAEEKIKVWRRVLAGRINKGILVACEELAKLGDNASAAKIKAVLDDLEAGCVKAPLRPDPDAKYPWLNAAELYPPRTAYDEMMKD